MFPRFFLLLVITVLWIVLACSPAILASSIGRECTRDEHCGPGQYCHLRTHTCVDCTSNNCSKWQRHPGTSTCPRSQAECGDCLPAFFKEDDHCTQSAAASSRATSDASATNKAKVHTDPKEPESQSQWYVIGFVAFGLVVLVFAGWAVYRNRRYLGFRKTNAKYSGVPNAVEPSAPPRQLACSPYPVPSERVELIPANDNVRESSRRRQHSYLHRAVGYEAGNFVNPMAMAMENTYYNLAQAEQQHNDVPGDVIDAAQVELHPVPDAADLGADEFDAPGDVGDQAGIEFHGAPFDNHGALENPLEDERDQAGIEFHGAPYDNHGALENPLGDEADVNAVMDALIGQVDFMEAEEAVIGENMDHLPEDVQVLFQPPADQIIPPPPLALDDAAAAMDEEDELVEQVVPLLPEVIPTPEVNMERSASLPSLAGQEQAAGPLAPSTSQDSGNFSAPETPPRPTPGSNSNRPFRQPNLVVGVDFAFRFVGRLTYNPTLDETVIDLGALQNDVPFEIPANANPQLIDAARVPDLDDPDPMDQD